MKKILLAVALVGLLAGSALADGFGFYVDGGYHGPYYYGPPSYTYYHPHYYGGPHYNYGYWSPGFGFSYHSGHHW